MIKNTHHQVNANINMIWITKSCCVRFVLYTKFLHLFLLQRCYDNGVEEIVDHKTWSESDSSWFGLAKFAWSG